MKKYPNKSNLCCPMCKGKGYIEINSENYMPRSPYVGKKETMELRNKLRGLNKKGLIDGLSLREIGALIGLKSAQQVKHHILMLDKLGWDKIEK